MTYTDIPACFSEVSGPELLQYLILVQPSVCENDRPNAQFHFGHADEGLDRFFV